MFFQKALQLCIGLGSNSKLLAIFNGHRRASASHFVKDLDERVIIELASILHIFAPFQVRGSSISETTGEDFYSDGEILLLLE